MVCNMLENVAFFNPADCGDEMGRKGSYLVQTLTKDAGYVFFGRGGSVCAQTYVVEIEFVRLKNLLLVVGGKTDDFVVADGVFQKRKCFFLVRIDLEQIFLPQMHSIAKRSQLELVVNYQKTVIQFAQPDEPFFHKLHIAAFVSVLYDFRVFSFG